MQKREREALNLATAQFRWWPAALAFMLLGAAYALISDQLRIGPPWELLVLAIFAVVGARFLHWRGRMAARRWLVLGSLALITLAITVSAAYLIGALLSRSTDAANLLRDGALLWTTNMLSFALSYWEVDGGGPAHRHVTGCGSTDFAFPQKVLGGEDEAGWSPDFLDYVFLAFNTSTAFSPTDTMVLSRRAKVMMMYQSVLSLTTVVVIVARAINAL
jgi:uncharacterized membrane protein